MDISLQFQTQELVLEPGAQVAPVTVYDLPADQEISLRLQVLFHKSRESVEVEAKAVGAKALEVLQQSNTFVQANLLHARSEFEGQCTVRCPRTGESRSGRGVCIECSIGAGTIRICC